MVFNMSVLWCTAFMAPHKSICAVPTLVRSNVLPSGLQSLSRICRGRSGTPPTWALRTTASNSSRRKGNQRERVRCNNLAAVVECRVESRAVTVLRYHLNCISRNRSHALLCIGQLCVHTHRGSTVPPSSCSSSAWSNLPVPVTTLMTTTTKIRKPRTTG